MAIQQQIQEMIAENSGLEAADVADADADLFAAGLSSLDCVRVLLAIEDELDLELPSEKIDREMFSTVNKLTAAVTEALGATA